ncbi:hypothetical protein PLICRDRAFT_41461 [Plicaturopsis crispa FD-325 SS-3]|nr:hypothetical protein PLICRDRAFT_41461 [Plicaturopsis crispa FD-325 SS-3]
MPSSDALPSVTTSTSQPSRRSAQLPLPSSGFGHGPVPVAPAPLSPTTTSLSHIRSMSNSQRPLSTSTSASNVLARIQGERGPGSPPPSATSATFPAHAGFASRTHAGGIQPSSSFFHPSRPSERPPSQSSDVSSYPGRPINLGDPDADVLPLHKMHSISDDEALSDNPPDEDMHKPTVLPMPQSGADTHRSRSTKHSREPLLPIGGGVARRPTISTVNSGPHNGPPSASSPFTPGHRVRNSIERVFRRGLSFDTPRSPTRSTTNESPVQFAPISANKAAHRISGAAGAATAMLELNEERDDSFDRSQYKRPISRSTMRSRSPVHTPHSQLDFNPNPPPGPPLAETRTADRNYKFSASRNRFFFGGRIMTGGDSPTAFIASVTVLLIIAGVWFGGCVPWWWTENGTHGRWVAGLGIYMVLVTISTMMATAFKDPGILPRNLDPDPPYPNTITTPSETGTNNARAPLPRDLKVRSDVVRVKYCPTCRTYRPPRSSHCKMCDNCVDGCDHHCQWVNNCVGRRNYTSFFVFLTSAVLTLALVIVTSALQVAIIAIRDQRGAKAAFARSPASVLAFCLAGLVVWPVTALLVYHMRLLLLNITTIEQIRNQAHKTLVPGPTPPNPFSHGSWRRNALAILCRPSGFSWLDPRGYATVDRREVNPGLVKGGTGAWA